MSVVVTDVFEYCTLFKKNSAYPWVYFLLYHFFDYYFYLTRQRAAFFSKLRKSRKATL